MSIVVTAFAAPRTAGIDARARRKSTVAAAVAGGVAAFSLALLGPSALAASPPAPTVVNRRRPGTAPDTGAREYRWYGVAMGEPACLLAVGDDSGPLDAGRARLMELAEKWAPAGRGSEIARLNEYPGVMLPVSADTVLLAERLDEVVVDNRHGTVGLASDHELSAGTAARALASDLVVREMLDAGAGRAAVWLSRSA